MKDTAACSKLLGCRMRSWTMSRQGFLAAVLNALEDPSAALIIESDKDVRAYQDEWHRAKTPRSAHRRG